MKVLIVDDDHDVADSLAALVRVVLDYDVAVSYDGREAIETAGEYQPDVVILTRGNIGAILVVCRRHSRHCWRIHSGRSRPVPGRVSVQPNAGLHDFLAQTRHIGVREAHGRSAFPAREVLEPHQGRSRHTS